ncbi:hypothetical protein [Edaphobacter modestus]|uniref:Uncharacterized protein n=1 Tax=Edaphobacter modestus TaxID=388466 RepID=A0A4Q7YGG7_9BACT|nr:hypothetical protein [Edaphobacter modestus]RZU35591.1 hypothetical protein BDD14_5667 [Edaphobacter modestus]
MNDLAKPELKHGVPLPCIPEVGHHRRMQRKLKFQSTAVCAGVIMIATCRGLALDPSQPVSSYLRKNFTIEDGLPANASRIVCWPAMCRGKTTELEEVRW